MPEDRLCGFVPVKTRSDMAEIHAKRIGKQATREPPQSCPKNAEVISLHDYKLTEMLVKIQACRQNFGGPARTGDSPKKEWRRERLHFLHISTYHTGSISLKHVIEQILAGSSYQSVPYHLNYRVGLNVGLK